MTVECSLSSLSVLAGARFEFSLCSISVLAGARFEISLASLNTFVLLPAIQWSLGSLNALAFDEPVVTVQFRRAVQIIG